MRLWGCLVLMLFASPARAEEFLKSGDNGSVSCKAYCTNDGGDWGRAGTCTRARVVSGPGAGGPIACDRGLNTLGELACYCNAPDGPPPGSVEKWGNNGSVNCDTFCTNGNEVWGPAGLCTGGRVEIGPGAGSPIACNKANGVIGSVVC